MTNAQTIGESNLVDAFKKRSKKENSCRGRKVFSPWRSFVSVSLDIDGGGGEGVAAVASSPPLIETQVHSVNEQQRPPTHAHHQKQSTPPLSLSPPAKRKKEKKLKDFFKNLHNRSFWKKSIGLGLASLRSPPI